MIELDQPSSRPAHLTPTSVNGTARAWLGAVTWLIEYEPTWFPEMGFGLALIGWGCICAFSADYRAHGSQLILPGAVVLLGLARCVVVARLWYAYRVILTALSMLVWNWVFWSLIAHYGLVSQEGVLVGIFVIEFLTALKFSLPCIRELVQEREDKRHTAP